jgi:hypothetical protein
MDVTKYRPMVDWPRHCTRNNPVETARESPIPTLRHFYHSPATTLTLPATEHLDKCNNQT